MKTLPILLIVVLATESLSFGPVPVYNDEWEDFASDEIKVDSHSLPKSTGFEQTRETVLDFGRQAYEIIRDENPVLAESILEYSMDMLQKYEEIVSDKSDVLSHLVKQLKIREFMIQDIQIISEDLMQLPKSVQLRIAKLGVKSLKAVFDTTITTLNEMIEQEELQESQNLVNKLFSDFKGDVGPVRIKRDFVGDDDWS